MPVNFTRATGCSDSTLSRLAGGSSWFLDMLCAYIRPMTGGKGVPARIVPFSIDPKEFKCIHIMPHRRRLASAIVARILAHVRCERQLLKTSALCSCFWKKTQNFLYSQLRCKLLQANLQVLRKTFSFITRNTCKYIPTYPRIRLQVINKCKWTRMWEFSQHDLQLSCKHFFDKSLKTCNGNKQLVGTSLHINQDLACNIRLTSFHESCNTYAAKSGTSWETFTNVWKSLCENVPIYLQINSNNPNCCERMLQSRVAATLQHTCISMQHASKQLQIALPALGVMVATTFQVTCNHIASATNNPLHRVCKPAGYDLQLDTD